MTRSQACRILGVSIDADMQEIKKKHRFSCALAVSDAIL